MLLEREIYEENLIFVFNNINYGKQFIDDCYNYLNENNDININIFLGMIPHLLMIYYASNNYFKNHIINFGNDINNLYDNYNDSTLNSLRSSILKLYTDKNSWQNNLNHLDILKSQSKPYYIYLFDGHIIGNTHLYFFKQFNNKYNVNELLKNLLSKFSIVRKIDPSWLCNLNQFNLNLKTNEINFNLKKNENYDLNCVIAFIDVLSSLNFYYFYLRNNAIDLIVDFCIKYQIFVNSLNSIKNLNDEISEKFFLNNEELFKLGVFENKYIKNSLVNKTKHWNYIDGYTSIDVISKFNENDKSLFTNIIEYLSGYKFTELSIEIENAIKEIIDILEKHIIVEDKKLHLYFIN